MKTPARLFILVLAFSLIAGPVFVSAQKAEQKAKPPQADKKADTEAQTKIPPAKQEKAFEEIIKDAEKLYGLFSLYQKEGQTFLEIKPEQFNRKYLFVPTQWTSVGRRVSGSYLPLRVFEFEKVEKKVLLVWKNAQYQAHKSAEYKRNLETVVPESIAHAFKIQSTPHPEHNSVLILLDDCFLTDFLGIGNSFSSPKNPYSVDKSRTLWGKIQSFPSNLELEVRYTLSSSRPRAESSVPDAAAITINMRFSLSEVPVDNGYQPRLGDDRIGYFMTRVYDYDRSGLDGTTVRYINRWHLKKKNPKAKLSEPRKPIVFWLENTIPHKYRKPIREGLLEWNKAYEKAGFKNAVVVKQMPDDAEWDPADIRYNTIRWVASLTGSGGGAFGPSRVNPFTGEILDADVVMFAPINYVFRYHSTDSPLDSRFPGEDLGFHIPGTMDPWSMDNEMLGSQRDFGIMDMLISGKIQNADEIPEQYMYDFYKFLACHEVGHTLGLRHNFKGSTTIKISDLHNTKLTGRKSIGNSIMEYLPANLASKGVKQGDYFQKTIGAWDYWVIQYGYQPIKADSPKGELPVLQKIASRSNEPELIYGTDEDSYDFGLYAMSVDPQAMTFDLSDDPLTHADQQIQRFKDIWEQIEERVLFEGRSYTYLRRAFASTLGQYYTALSRTVKWIGGIYHYRTHVGDPGQRLPFQVAEYEKQRRALDLIKTHLLDPKAFEFSPEFYAKLQADRFMDFETFFRIGSNPGGFRFDFSMADSLQRYYNRMLGTLYDPMRLKRIQDNEALTSDKKLLMADYLKELHQSIWSELDEGRSPNRFRRILHREYLNRITTLLQKPGPVHPEDAAAVCRFLLKQLQSQIQSYLTKQVSADLITCAHFENCLDMIQPAIKTIYVKTTR